MLTVPVSSFKIQYSINIFALWMLCCDALQISYCSQKLKNSKERGKGMEVVTMYMRVCRNRRNIDRWEAPIITINSRVF